MQQNCQCSCFRWRCESITNWFLNRMQLRSSDKIVAKICTYDLYINTLKAKNLFCIHKTSCTQMTVCVLHFLSSLCWRSGQFNICLWHLNSEIMVAMDTDQQLQNRDRHTDWHKKDMTVWVIVQVWRSFSHNLGAWKKNQQALMDQLCSMDRSAELASLSI